MKNMAWVSCDVNISFKNLFFKIKDKLILD